MEKWSKWYIFDGAVRRYGVADDDRKVWQRYPKAKYKHITSAAELEKLVARLNHRYEAQLAVAKAAYDLRHRFISQDLLDEFEQLLKAEIPNKNVATSLYTYLRRHCLHWFVNQLGVQDPVDWKLHEKAWGLALICKQPDEKLAIWSEPVHPDTVMKHVQILNRFLRFLHQRMPKEIPPVVLEPLTKAQARLYRAEYSADGTGRGQLITEADWCTMEKKIDLRIRAFVQLGYYYGLRQSECLGVNLEELFEDALEIKRQLVAYADEKPTFAPLKNRSTSRQVPHWFLKPKEAYVLLTNAPPLMHPDSFYKLFKNEMQRLKMPYGLHDLRRSFITRAFRIGKLPRDIQLAAGHADLDTTLRYAQDDRGLQRKRYVP